MWFNPIVAAILRSPLHSWISGSVMLVNYTGRKSGKSYTLPVNYLRDEDALITISFRKRTWWRNLLDGSSLKLLLQGRTVSGQPQVLRTDEEVVSALARVVRLAPQYAHFLKIRLDAGGQPDPGDLMRAAMDRVVILWKVL